MNPSKFTEQAAKNASLAPIVRDLVKDGDSASNTGFYEVPVPDGCNRCEIVCTVAGGAAGDLLVYRAVTRERSPSSEHIRVLAATLAYNARGARTVLELAPGIGLLQASQTGLPALATMNATAIFWRQE